MLELVGGTAIVTVLGLVGGVPGGETPRVADSTGAIPLAGASIFQPLDNSLAEVLRRRGRVAVLLP